MNKTAPQDEQLSKKERREQKRAEKAAAQRSVQRTKTFRKYTAIALISLGLSIGGYFSWGFINSRFSGKAFDITETCVTHVRPAMHTHQRLSIIIDGEQQDVPANIGVSIGCMRAMHTHDADGIIHVEPPIVRENLLREFFQIWGQPFDQQHILDKIVDDQHRIVMTVNGVPSDKYGDLILEDGQNIVISYETIAADEKFQSHDATDEPPMRTITIEGTDFAFSPSTINASAGEELTVTFVNAGSAPHTFDIDELGIHTGTLYSGDTKTFTFTAPDAPVTYRTYCAIPGHVERGMVGTLVVE